MWLQHFDMKEIITKCGQTVKRLQAVHTNANMEFVINFIDTFLIKFIHHRNELKYYRSTINDFKEHFNCTMMDVDLSENLSVPVKYEPQCLHWSHKQVSMHSGIFKSNGEKVYHIYLSEDKVHGQQFIGVTLNQMLNNTDDTGSEYLLIESDNAYQYKSCQHFDIVQELANKRNQMVIRNYGIPEHGKGEVDHVGGIGKTTLRRAIARGKFLDAVPEMVDHLKAEFGNKECPCYVIDEVKEEDLKLARNEAANKAYGTITGSNSIRSILFTPFAETIKVSPRVCLCNKCKERYGSCELFIDCYLPVTHLKPLTLRSHTEDIVEPFSHEGFSHVTEFLLADSVCAIASSSKSTDPVWLMRIISSVQQTY